MKRAIGSFWIAVAIAGVSGCSASHHRAEVTADDGERITLGTVQKEVSIGMAAAEVAAALGSPNIVTTTDNHRETWIYDKISSDVGYSRSRGAIVGLLFGSSAAGGGIGRVSAGASSTSQRTLTIIIKFDENDRVRDFSYHTTRF